MRKLIVFVALFSLMLLPGRAYSASCDTNTDKWNIGQWCVDKYDTMIPTTSAGSQVVTEQYTAAANNTLASEESGKIIVDTGGASSPGLNGSCSKHILPRAAAGLSYTFVTGSKCEMTIDTVDSSDTIFFSPQSVALDAGDSIKNSVRMAGVSVTLVSAAANRWSPVGIASSDSIWVDNGTN